jgi:hypothetical protein
MGNVMLIPARRQVGNNARKQEEEKPKLRVTAYCRVSTDSDEQATSYEAQVEHYTEYIQKILIGNLPVFMPMTVSPALTPRNVKNLIT